MKKTSNSGLPVQAECNEAFRPVQYRFEDSGSASWRQRIRSPRPATRRSATVPQTPWIFSRMVSGARPAMPSSLILRRPNLEENLLQEKTLRHSSLSGRPKSVLRQQPADEQGAPEPKRNRFRANCMQRIRKRRTRQGFGTMEGIVGPSQPGTARGSFAPFSGHRFLGHPMSTLRESRCPVDRLRKEPKDWKGNENPCLQRIFGVVSVCRIASSCSRFLFFRGSNA